MRGWKAALMVVLALGGAQSCRDGTGPVAGVLNVVLDTPNSGTDGAILLTVTGPAPLTSGVPGAGLRLFSQGLGTTTRFAVTGTLTGGTILRIGVPDIRQALSYTATVEQVAAANYQLRATADYSLTVGR
jgi:hypothetical protein